MRGTFWRFTKSRVSVLVESVPPGTGERYGRPKRLMARAQVQRTTWYGLPYGACPEGPRRGRTVPHRTLSWARGTVRFGLGGY